MIENLYCYRCPLRGGEPPYDTICSQCDSSCFYKEEEKQMTDEESKRSYEDLLIEITSIIDVLRVKMAKLASTDLVAWERLAKAGIKLVEGRTEIEKMRHDEIDKETTTRKLEEMGKWGEPKHNDRR